MKTSLAIVVCAVALALVMFAPSKASAGGRYYDDGYGYGYAYGYCCPTCGYVRGRGFNRRYGYGRAYGSPRYAYGRYGYGRGYPRARGYARRSARRGW